MNALAARPTLWSAEDAARATQARRHGGDWRAAGVSIDSRSLEAGDLFIALTSERDGHEFVAGAFAKGAAAALVARDDDPGQQRNLLLVDDTQQAMEALGQAGRKRSAARYVAVTGSVGKTSTKESLRHVLADQALTAASAASYNNHIGVPLTLARVPPEARYAVIEIGMNHAGEIAPLSRQARPDVSVITTIGSAHLENLGTIDAIAVEKAQIFSGMKGGVAVLNRDNAYFPRLADLAKGFGIDTVIGFGRHGDADMRLLDCSLDREGSDAVARYRGRDIRYRVGAPGEHWVLNSLAVLAAVDALGADIVRAANSLASVQALSGRGARHRVAVAGGTLDLIDESYNASPVAVRAALAVLAATQPGAGGRRIAVLGDMRELGPDAARLHGGLAGDVHAAGIDLLFACGAHMRALIEALPATLKTIHADQSTGLIAPLIGQLRAGDVVMVKGSLGTRMKPIIEAILALDRKAAGR
jgi:UDP-N-acetylmuramoyl-tripeptide--D-alanyl-D-alanine ligase